MSKDPSHISDTILQSSSDKQGSRVAEATEAISKVDALDDTQGFQVSSLLERIKEIEGQLQRKDASEAELRERNKKLEAQCKDLEAGMKEISPKYQDALNEVGQFEYETNQALQRESTLRNKYKTVVAELTKAREQMGTLDAELAAARSRLSMSSIPEVVELEKMAEDVRATRGENECLQRRFDSSKKDAEFAREQYQQASAAAGGAARELLALKEQVATLTEKANENTLRAHEIYNSSEIQQHLDRIKELEAEKDALELDIERKADEVKTLMNGRRGTRGASVPRSPHMGNANVMSPGPQRAIGRVMASGNRSRGSSPVPGERSLPQEALFQGPQSRWWTHLQG
jgi:chromosome segregation ATPase